MNKKFLIKNLFNIINNPQLDKENFIFSERAKYPYFTRTENNNGIYGYVKYFDDDHLIPGNSLAVGMISMRFHYMHHDFYAGQFTKTLIPKFRGFNENLAMYFIAILNKHSAYYQSYLVRHFKEKISETVVDLPVIKHSDSNHEYTVDDIDWQYMEDRIKELEEDRIKELEAYLKVTNLDDYELTDEDKEVLSLSRKSASDENSSLETGCKNGALRFKRFIMHDIFEPLKVTKAKKSEVRNFKSSEFCVPVVYAKFGDNGIMYWGRKNQFTTYENVISIVYNGAIAAGKVYAQEEPTGILAESYFIQSKYKRVPFRANLYMAQVIEHKIYPIYSRENLAIWNERVENEIIYLPVTPDGKPDFDYMERYIRAIEKLTIADVVKYKGKVIDTTKMLVNSQS